MLDKGFCVGVSFLFFFVVSFVILGCSFIVFRFWFFYFFYEEWLLWAFLVVVFLFSVEGEERSGACFGASWFFCLAFCSKWFFFSLGREKRLDFFRGNCRAVRVRLVEMIGGGIKNRVVSRRFYIVSRLVNSRGSFMVGCFCFMKMGGFSFLEWDRYLFIFRDVLLFWALG